MAMLGPEFDTVLDAARRGDEQAFARLWRDLNPMLVRFAGAQVGAAGEDIASETWLAVMAGLDRFEGGEQGFRSWVFTIARHKMIDLHRTPAASRTSSLEDAADLPEAMAADVADVVEQQQATAEALRLIGRLSPDQAEIILLRVLVGLDVAAVAQIVGRSPGAVRVAAHRGLRRLADILSSEGRTRVTAEPVATFRDRDV